MAVIFGSLIGEIEFPDNTIDEDGLIGEIVFEDSISVPIDDDESLIAEIEFNEIFAFIDQYPIVQDANSLDAIFEKKANKNQPNGYAGLNGDGKIESSLFAYDYYNEDFSLTVTDIANKKLVLSKTPIFPQSVVVIPYGALPQRYGIDYVVVSNEIQWSGLGLDGFLNDVGEAVRVQYKSEE